MLNSLCTDRGLRGLDHPPSSILHPPSSILHPRPLVHHPPSPRDGKFGWGAAALRRLGLVCLLAALGNGAVLASAPATVVNGHARFSLLSPTLIRLEYSPSGKFVDELGLSVINRTNWPAAAWTREESEGWLTLRTARLSLRYRVGSAALGPENLRLNWTDATGPRTWKPGDVDDRNLGGVPGDMAGLVQPVTNSGPLSRNGYFLLDDSRTALRDVGSRWVKPRPEKESQDWYFLLYGRDYQGGLQELAGLIGPSPMPPRYIFGTWFGSKP